MSMASIVFRHMMNGNNFDVTLTYPTYDYALEKFQFDY